MTASDVSAARRAICATRGGWDNADDEAIMRLWAELTPQERERALSQVERPLVRDAIEHVTDADDDDGA